jgi:hypothetical protein
MKKFLLLFSLLLVITLSIVFIIRNTMIRDRTKLLGLEISEPNSEGINNGFKFSEIGVSVGDTIKEMHLIGLDYSTKSASDCIEPGKLTVFISGSYTCDVTRNQMPNINEFVEKSGANTEVYLVHTLESHPFDVSSPYSHSEEPWLVESNLDLGIYATQPQTLGERIQLSVKWNQETDIHPHFLLDDENNSFWSEFGQGPNMAIVVSGENVVLFKQEWFEKEELENFIQSINP